eukprot:CAMPEP_0185755176 /NCGR_PEP_ID=MMETSP1174-20130828/13700_1 /TAXON_ID=35687 /ORGANISM="Dictyocha speculum, Strain CCMP1381" /LENGTH=89 /DNA_ID=CAMNT_0028433627 /DNA_START=278 /DNA_END=547 /DNA_ORIENTATION=+
MANEILRAAASGSRLAKTADITATPSAPLAISSWQLCSSTPPTPNTGKGESSGSLCSPVCERPSLMSEMSPGPSAILPGWLIVSNMVPT